MKKAILAVCTVLLTSHLTYSFRDDSLTTLSDDARSKKIMQIVIPRAGNAKKYVNGVPPLLYAVRQGNIDRVEGLLEENIDINTTDKDKNTALMIAAQKSNGLQLIKSLLKKQPALNKQNNAGQTALMLAIRYKNIETALLLLQHKADIEIVDNTGQTALMHAASLGLSEIVEELLAQGADSAKKDKKGKTALDHVKDSIKMLSAQVKMAKEEGLPREQIRALQKDIQKQLRPYRKIKKLLTPPQEQEMKLIPRKANR
jgi:ankyrin repeat protein